jgi:hypothetical protein
MKSKTNQLTLIYIIIALFLAIVFSQLSHFLVADYPFYISQRTFLIFYWYYFRYILSANDNRNKVILKTQEK